ncbi:hypothetical protein RB195_016351 [Necator americanus]|uniref:SXP/RAL-2 family protein Ani s 5-like cation-binding domain-containing protein n=1 Tax=Necator americanus TaxID=51031 RepID=A0ABR1E8R3_NECAM
MGELFTTLCRQAPQHQQSYASIYREIMFPLMIVIALALPSIVPSMEEQPHTRQKRLSVAIYLCGSGYSYYRAQRFFPVAQPYYYYPAPTIIQPPTVIQPGIQSTQQCIGPCVNGQCPAGYQCNANNGISMRYVLLVSIALAVVYCEGPVYVQELEALVQAKNDKQELRSLADNRYMIRSEKLKRLKVILRRLSPAIQAKYKNTINEEKAKKKKLLEMQRADAKKWGYQTLLMKIVAIDSDMSISDAEASKREQALLKALTPSQRKDFEAIKQGRKARNGSSTWPIMIILCIVTIYVFIFYQDLK